MSSGYARTLAVPGARRLLLSSVVARLPLGMSLAVLLLVHDRTGRFADAGVVVGALGLAAAANGPVLGRLVDRLGQARVLLSAAAVQATALLGLVLAARAGAGVPALAALGAVAGASLPPVAACLRVLWADLAPDADAREAAFALDATVQEVIWMGGPLLVGGLVALVSPSAAVAGMAVVTLAGTSLFVATPAARRWRASGTARGGVLRARGMLVLLAGAAGAGVSMGTLEVGLPALADGLDAPGATGPLLALASVGSFAGGLAYGARSWRSRPSRRVGALLAVAGLLLAPLALAGSVAAGAVLATTSGMAWAPALACTYSLVGRLAPPGAVAEAFTWSSAAIGGGIGLGIALGGALATAGGAGAAFAAGSVAALAAAATTWAGRGRLAGADVAPAAPVEAPALERRAA